MLKKILFLFFLLQVSLFPQQKQMSAVRVSEPPVINGVLDDAAWRHAVPGSDFTQQEPLSGAPASQRTEVRMVYDDKNLYLGVMCYDAEPASIIARELKWDGKMSGDDYFMLVFDTFNDDRTAYWFGTNPLGMHDDALLTGFEMSGFNESWNGIWDVKGAISDSGWSVEFIFPFSTFKFPDTHAQVWGVNFLREIKRTGEQMQWTAIGPDKGLFKLSYAGNLTGISGIRRGDPLYLKPFLSAGREWRQDGGKSILKPGLDIKYGITQSMSLDVTFNTDFAQVESDRAKINLSRFPLFFPEKRDFFLEGAEIFNFPLGGNNRVFYSRRIGIRGGGEVPITAGAKLVGRTGPLDLGILSVQTRTAGGYNAANYSVLRGKFDLFRQSFAGFMVTNFYDKGSFNRVYGADMEYSVNDLWGDKNLKVGGGLVKSDENGGGKNSFAGKLYVDYPNDLIDQYASYRFLQKEFNPAMGFLSRRGVQWVSYNIAVTPRVSGLGEIRKLGIQPLSAEVYMNDKGEMVTGEFASFPLGFITHQGDKFQAGVKRTFDRVETPFTLFGNKTVQAGDYWFTEAGLELETSPGRPVYGEIELSAGSYFGGRRTNAAASVIITRGANLTFLVDYEYNRVALQGDAFTTGEAGATVRYDFSTRMFSSVFAQWNNEEKELNLNYRFNWMPHIGSNFYFVVNHLLSSSGSLRTKDLTVISKFVWLIVW